jgi:hypothetical protein
LKPKYLGFYLEGMMEIYIGSIYTDGKGLACRILDMGPGKIFSKKIEKPLEIYVKYEIIFNERQYSYPKIGKILLTSKKAFLIWAKKEIEENPTEQIKKAKLTSISYLPMHIKRKQTYYILPDNENIVKTKPEKFIGTLRAFNLEHAKELFESQKSREFFESPKEEIIIQEELPKKKSLNTYYLTLTGVVKKKPNVVLKRIRASNIEHARELLGVKN